MDQQVITVSTVNMPPILCSVPNAGALIGRGVSAIYELIGAGKIRAVKSDGRTLIVVASLHEYAATLQRLHPAKVAPPRKRKPQHLRAKKPEATDAESQGPPRPKRNPQHLRQAETTNP